MTTRTFWRATVEKGKKNLSSKFLTLALISGFVFGCAKQRPYDELYKDQNLVSRSAISTQTEYLYAPTSLGVPRFTEAMNPYIQGREKIIKWKWTKAGLTAYQLETNSEFQDNEVNNKPILTIPGEYVAYRCAANTLDECTNREEVNSETRWEERDQFIPRYEDIIVHEADSLDLPTSNDSCFSPAGSRLVHREVSRDFINIELEKSYKFSNSQSCVMELWYSSDSYEEFLDKIEENGGTFNTRVFFSFAALESITDKKYKPIEYPVEDHPIFGFFKTNKKQKNPSRQIERTYIVNRWSPKKEGAVDKNGNRILNYILSKEFAKPSNAYLKKATIKAINRINFTLKKSRVKLRLTLRQGDETTKPGDLRNTMINLVEDIASPLIGYGPSVANPKTGEIVKAHTNMYKGSLESYAPYTYASIRAFEENMKKSLATIPRRGGNAPGSSANVGTSTNSPRNTGANATLAQSKYQKALIQIEKIFKSKKTDLKLPQSMAIIESELARIKNRKYERISFKTLASKIRQAFEKENYNGSQLTQLKRILNSLERKEKGLNALRRNNGYTTDMFNFQALGKVTIDDIDVVQGIRDSKGVLRPWTRLTVSQRQRLTEILVTHAYVPTLIHELGHNIGLRHNFEGSADKNNYWTEKNRKILGLRSGAAHSSIMDYAYSGLNELSTFGPYDIAALLFAYNREVATIGQCRESGEVRHGNDQTPICKDIINKHKDDIFFHNINDKLATANSNSGKKPIVTINPISGTLGGMNPSTRIPFKYCTDENAGTSLMCNRFDEGSNEVEVVNYMIQDYQESYALRNIRWRRKNMNESDHIWHLIGSYRRLLGIRNHHEQWQVIYNIFRQFGFPEVVLQKGCPHGEFRTQYAGFCEFIDPAIEANYKAGRFLLDMAKTPDKICHALVKSQTGQTEEVFLNLGQDINYIEGPMLTEPSNPASRIGSYRPLSCHDQYVVKHYQEQAQNSGNGAVQIQMIGETGKYHNDVSALHRNGVRNYIGDLEVRGFWMEKLQAMEMLTHRDLITLAGAKQHMSFADHPDFKDEIMNLIEHYNYGAPLLGHATFEAKNGLKYHAVREPNLNYETSIPRMQWILQIFLPFPDKENWNLGQAMTQMAVNASLEPLRDLPNDIDFIKEARSFRDSITVNRYGLSSSVHQSWDNDLVTESYIIPELEEKYIATERNTLAFKTIKRLKGELDAKAKSIEALKVVIDNAQESSDTTTDTGAEAEEEQPSAGQMAIAEVIQNKYLTNIFAKDVKKIERLAFLAGGNQQVFFQLLLPLFKEWGDHRTKMAMAAFELKNVPPEDEKIKKLNEMDLYELLYHQYDEKGKNVVKQELTNGLIGIPQRQTMTL